MTRFAAAENESASSAPHVPYCVFAAIDLASGILRLCSTDREYTFGGNTYLPLNKLGAILPVKESAGLTPEKLELTLSGVDNSLIASTLTEKYHGRSVSLYVGFWNENTTALVADPHLLWEGSMDTMAIKTDEASSVISLVCENRLLIWNQASGWLYTHEHQGLLSGIATDNFFDQVQSLASKILKWGGALVFGGGGGGSGGGRVPPSVRPA